jgi:signal transduction histidine kinase
MPAPTEPRATGLARLRVAQVLGFATLLPLVVVGVAIAVGIVALTHQSSVRDELVNRVQPAAIAVQSLETGLVNQETGVRGYELAAMPSFLAPYHLGRRQERQALAELRRSSVIGSRGALAQATGRIDDWQRQASSPAIAGVTPGHPHATATVDAVLGKRLFDRVRRSLAVLQRDIDSRAVTVKRDLDSAARTSVITFIAIGVALLVSVFAAALTLRRTVTKPLEELTGSSRVVAGGELSKSLLVAGPLEIAQLGRDVDAMRQRLVRELEASHAAQAQLGETASELVRSNAELEQFAYVASHDLQEPLRKVTSFCQMLQDRYGGQLDERADQYIEFAVDGAKRMQQLINDLLAFSRVGRVTQPRELVDLNAVAQAALDDLDEALAAAHAQVVVDDLPRLSVQAPLIRVVFQNLIGNAIKFHGDSAPEVRITATEREDDWLFACADNGIGIEPEYAERIFVIFQRLHTRDRYEGTGIGLAMCRKIVEYHGGRIWLDTEYTGGTRIWFTLPAQEHSDTMVA